MLSCYDLTPSLLPVPGEAEPVYPGIWHSRMSRCCGGRGGLCREQLLCVATRQDVCLSWRAYRLWLRVLGDEGGAVVEAFAGPGSSCHSEDCHLHSLFLWFFSGTGGLMGAITCT